MARVYYAWDEKLQRPVAIKLIDESYRDRSGYTERFIREASFVSTWRHPNIPQVYYAGEEDGLYYYVMEYIPGRDLAEILREEKAAGKLLPVPEVLRIVRAVSEALDYAHQRGVVHRDVKPSNVIIADDGRIVLTDFGLALNLSQGTVGEVFGSPHYISPEQAQNSARAVPQSDLYSLGIMLYEMLTGFVPFDDPSPATLAYQHISQAPPLPSALNPLLSPQVEAVLLKAIQKSPQDRFATGQELSSALVRAFDADVSATQVRPAPGRTDPARGESPAGGGLAASLPPARLAPAQNLPAAGAAAVFAAPATPKAQPVPRRSPARSRWGAGCALTLAGLAVVVIAILLGLQALPGMLGSGAGPAASRATATPPATPVPPPTAAAAVAPTAVPPQTETPTATLTSTPTDTPTPTATPVLMSVYFFVPKKTSGLVIVNQGEISLAFKDLQIRSGSSQIRGDAWDAITLASGDCAFIVADTRDIERAGDLGCNLGQNTLHWTGGGTFWTSRFDIYYQGQEIGACTGLPDRSGGCTSTFAAPTPTPSAEPSPGAGYPPPG